ncbi:hypothetical protein TNCV_3255071, partial [Trichonephila clavipes]
MKRSLKVPTKQTDSGEIKSKAKKSDSTAKTWRNFATTITPFECERCRINCRRRDLHLLEVRLESLEGIRDDPVLHERDQALEIFKETVEFEKRRYIQQLPFR